MPLTAHTRTLQALAAALRAEALPGNWPVVLALANDHLMTPALWTALADSALAAGVPTDVAEYIQALHRMNGQRNARIRAQILELAGALNGAGIVPVLLKGALTLFAGPYRDNATRMMRDIDLLVPVSQRELAIGVLHQTGYHLARFYGETHHAFGDFARDGEPAAVDLHIELVDPKHLQCAEEVRERATERQIEGVRLLLPSPNDRVLHNFLHAQLHHLGHYYRGELPVSQLYELSALAHAFGKTIDWRFIEARLEEHRLGPALRAYVLAATRLFGPQWPLSTRPGARSRLHCLRCDLQTAASSFQWLGATWGNLTGPLAWHRMRALYGGQGNAFAWRCRHIVRFVRKKGARAGLARLRRSA